MKKLTKKEIETLERRIKIKKQLIQWTKNDIEVMEKQLAEAMKHGE